MAGEPQRTEGVSTRLAMAGRRFHAWWEGYAFDEALEREDVALRLGSVTAGPSVEAEIAEWIWGVGRHEPGDPAFTMRLARTLGLATKARVTALGAGGGAVMRDLRSGTKWKVSGLGRAAHRVAGLDLRSYDEAMARLNKGVADGALCFFELHRDADPAAFGRFASELVKPGAPATFVDFAVARKGVRLKSCFAGPWPGAPRVADDYVRALKDAGFTVADTADETRAFLPLIARGWAHWKRAYDAATRTASARLRAERLRALSDYAQLWAERYDALRSGQLQALRIQARKMAG